MGSRRSMSTQRLAALAMHMGPWDPSTAAMSSSPTPQGAGRRRSDAARNGSAEDEEPIPSSLSWRGLVTQLDLPSCRPAVAPAAWCHAVLLPTSSAPCRWTTPSRRVARPVVAGGGTDGVGWRRHRRHLGTRTLSGRGAAARGLPRDAARRRRPRLAMGSLTTDGRAAAAAGACRGPTARTRTPVGRASPSASIPTSGEADIPWWTPLQGAGRQRSFAARNGCAQDKEPMPSSLSWRGLVPQLDLPLGRPAVAPAVWCHAVPLPPSAALCRRTAAARRAAGPLVVAVGTGGFGRWWHGQHLEVAETLEEAWDIPSGAAADVTWGPLLGKATGADRAPAMGLAMTDRRGPAAMCSLCGSPFSSTSSAVGTDSADWRLPTATLARRGLRSAAGLARPRTVTTARGGASALAAAAPFFLTAAMAAGAAARMPTWAAGAEAATPGSASTHEGDGGRCVAPVMLDVFTLAPSGCGTAADVTASTRRRMPCGEVTP